MSKRLIYDGSLREHGALHEQLLEGVEQLALAVGSTLGPRGRNVILDRAGETPLVTKDGVTVARNIQLSDPVHHAAIKMVQAVARATVEEAGDGTTTATILAHRIFEAGLRAIHAGANPILLQRSVQYGVSLISDRIRKSAQAPTDRQIAQVATISTNGNTAIGDLILDAIKAVGRDGVITLDDSPTPKTWLEVRDGFRFEGGWVSPDFITDRNRGVAVLENPLIFFTERLLSQGVSPVPTLHDLGPLMNYAAGLSENTRVPELVREPRPLLIVAEDIVGDALTSLTLNHVKQNIKACAVRAPGFGELRRAALADMAMATGGKVLSMESGQAVSRWIYEGKQYNPAVLGTCARAVVSNGRTIFEEPAGDPNDSSLVKRFAENLRAQALEMTDPQSREMLLQRAARLTGAVAVIRVGAQTESEARSLRDLVEDAVLAVRAALAEGIVPGGGMCLFAMSKALRNTRRSTPPSGSLSWFRKVLPGLRPEAPAEPEADPTAAAAMELLADCLESPLRQIARNAGEDPDKVVAVIEGVARERQGRLEIGYNAALNQYEDLLGAGVVDPAKVVRVALEKAASIASLMLTSSCLITFEEGQNRVPASPIPANAGVRP